MNIKNAAIEELTEAIRLTVEYIGTNTLYPGEGWSWYDALRKYAPEKAEQLRLDHERLYVPAGAISTERKS